MKLSLFASAVRPHLWNKFIQSLKGSRYDYEIVFAGFIDPELYEPFVNDNREFHYIQTEDIKPSQCYEVARRACWGELVLWVADDCEFSESFVDKVVDYWHSLSNYKAVVSCKTNENGNNETMLNHRFFGRNQNTPLMAPIGLMSREYLQVLGGLDRRYICGQYENDIVMRVLADGGKVHLFEDAYVLIDHKNKHGSETNFWSGYNEDREQLENSWVKGGYIPSPEKLLILPLKPSDPAPYFYFPLNNTEVTFERNDVHEPFEDKNLLTRSQSRRGQWR